MLFYLFSTVLCFVVSSQVPSGYYNGTDGLTGIDLKTALNNIIKNHIEYPYTSSSTDVWDILKETDKDPNNPNNVILLYSGWSKNGNQEFNGGSGWNREHVWPKSRGDFGDLEGAGTDVHALRPCDISVNSSRSNRWFAECDIEHIDGDGPTGCYTSATEWVWKPNENVKGDVARMIFYMATRYEGENYEGIDSDGQTLPLITAYPGPSTTNAEAENKDHAKNTIVLLGNIAGMPSSTDPRVSDDSIFEGNSYMIDKFTNLMYLKGDKLGRSGPTNSEKIKTHNISDYENINGTNVNVKTYNYLMTALYAFARPPVTLGSKYENLTDLTFGGWGTPPSVENEPTPGGRTPDTVKILSCDR